MTNELRAQLARVVPLRFLPTYAVFVQRFPFLVFTIYAEIFGNTTLKTKKLICIGICMRML
jgi:hypothetical protein